MNPASPVLARLRGGDRRSIGHADAVVTQVLDDPTLFDTLWQGLRDADPVVRMRAADALEKVTRHAPDRLAPYKADLVSLLAATEQKAVRWHLAQMAPRLRHSAVERDALLGLLECLLTDDSRIVRVHAMQAIADLSAADPVRRVRAIALIEAAMRAGSAAVKARGRKLLARLSAVASPRPQGMRR